MLPEKPSTILNDLLRKLESESTRADWAEDEADKLSVEITNIQSLYDEKCDEVKRLKRELSRRGMAHWHAANDNSDRKGKVA